MTRQGLLVLFGLIAGLGLVTILLGGFGNLMAIGATGGVYGSLDARGLAGDEALVGELYAVVLAPRWAWSVVQLLGVAVLLLAGTGFWRALKAAR